MDIGIGRPVHRYRLEALKGHGKHQALDGGVYRKIEFARTRHQRTRRTKDHLIMFVTMLHQDHRSCGLGAIEEEYLPARRLCGLYVSGVDRSSSDAGPSRLG